MGQKNYQTFMGNNNRNGTYSLRSNLHVILTFLDISTCIAETMYLENPRRSIGGIIYVSPFIKFKNYNLFCDDHDIQSIS
jgi:hypothetical protein